MEVVYRRCCGVDVHKKMIVACLMNGAKRELREYGTTTAELRELNAWLTGAKCEMIAMESTGVYWKPLYNLFELSGLEAIVVNAAHMKALPGRKTDVKDAEWIADLLRHGLLRASFIPSREQREFRESARYRKSLVEERAREVNRLQKILEGANIKLSSVVGNMNGVSSRKLLDKIAADEPMAAENVSDMLHGSMRPKLDQIMRAIDGITTPLQRKLIAQIVDHIDDMTKRIADMDDMIKGYMAKYETVISAVNEMVGVGRRSAEVIISEIGIDMGRFPSAAHLCSWAGVSPGNYKSAGKRQHGIASLVENELCRDADARSQAHSRRRQNSLFNLTRYKTTKGNKALKSILTQCAKAASKSKDSFFAAQYQRIAAHRGKNRATVAVAHSMLIAIYHMIKNGVAFHDLGGDYYNSFNREHKIRGYLKRLYSLGWSPNPEVVPA